ncbi:HAMP domain-containing sensor histidine kinase [Ectobacillus panaciterrae]|uniref:HAMP domain-containing sensor histidine kinase n=1 Tax=Ectobacillus panaciterrae TaxID=363872 RepID=UPI00040DF394|nr:HAMP domain-containing histidine kinase [Ectobacillus panaciterrae]
MMKRIWIFIASFLHNLPIKWKLTLWSTFLLFVLFASYNLLQYVVLDHWTVNYEEQQGSRQLQEVQAYLTDKKENLSAQTVAESEEFLSSINDRHQLIRISDDKGHPIVTVSNEVEPDWIPPEHVNSRQYTIKHHHEDRLLVMRQPIQLGTFSGTIEIIRSMDMFDKFIDKVFIVMISAGVGGLLLSFFGGRIIANQLLSNLQTITDTMHRIRTNGLMERVPVRNNRDELAKLGRLFNELMDDVEESFLQQKQFVEDASHELRTPLTIVHGHLSMLNRWGKHNPEVLQKSLQSSLKEIERLNSLVAELLELSRAESEQTHSVAIEAADVDSITERVTKNFEVLYPNFMFECLLEAGDTRTSMPARYFEQVLVILIDNAVKYAKEEEKQVILRSGITNGHIFIRVEDKGLGIPQAELPYVLNRFYRVDKARSRKQGGNGLGLAIAKRLIEKYGGRIMLESQEGEGTVVTLLLPVNQ